ncbi:hypothetical protein BJX66DRAFT_294831 [Aspergillus keveii]|uniref:Secreted protein n=1 Tax=Aspergillus keveii TaxID=714993 RepID=A0ABR4GIJ8_9EURO
MFDFLSLQFLVTLLYRWSHYCFSRASGTTTPCETRSIAVVSMYGIHCPASSSASRYLIISLVQTILDLLN